MNLTFQMHDKETNQYIGICEVITEFNEITNNIIKNDPIASILGYNESYFPITFKYSIATNHLPNHNLEALMLEQPFNRYNVTLTKYPMPHINTTIYWQI